MTPLQISVYAVNCDNSDERADEVCLMIERYAREFAKEKVNEQRDLMAKHLNMRNVPKPQFLKGDKANG